MSDRRKDHTRAPQMEGATRIRKIRSAENKYGHHWVRE